MSSAKCPNCGANLSCGCQRRTASNGASCCTMCLGHLEGTLKNKGKVIPKPVETPIFPGVSPGLGITSPGNVQVNVTNRNADQL